MGMSSYISFCITVLEVLYHFLKVFLFSVIITRNGRVFRAWQSLFFVSYPVKVEWFKLVTRSNRKYTLLGQTNQFCNHLFILECIQGTSFLWQTQIQTIEYGPDDTIRIKSKEVVILIPYSYAPSDMNFQRILANFCLTKSWSVGIIFIWFKTTKVTFFAFS